MIKSSKSFCVIVHVSFLYITTDIAQPNEFVNRNTLSRNIQLYNLDNIVCLAYIIYTKVATWPSGKAEACKAFIPQFESGCRLFNSYKPTSKVGFFIIVDFYSFILITMQDVIYLEDFCQKH